MDVSVYDADDNGAVKELHRASGGPWGVASVRSTYIAWLTKIFGVEAMKKLKDDEIEAYSDLLQTIQKKLPDISVQDIYTITVSALLNRAISKEDVQRIIKSMYINGEVKYISGGKLCVSAQIVMSWFQESINNGIRHMSGILSKPAMHDVNTIVFVGEFVRCPYVQEKVVQALNNRMIVIPEYPEDAVLKGSVLLGHQ